MNSREIGLAAAAADAAANFRRVWEDDEPEIIAVAPGRRARTYTGPSAYKLRLPLAPYALLCILLVKK